jgi:hypothetical protein
LLLVKGVRAENGSISLGAISDKAGFETWLWFNSTPDEFLEIKKEKMGKRILTPEDRERMRLHMAKMRLEHPERFDPKLNGLSEKLRGKKLERLRRKELKRQAKEKLANAPAPTKAETSETEIVRPAATTAEILGEKPEIKSPEKSSQDSSGIPTAPPPVEDAKEVQLEDLFDEPLKPAEAEKIIEQEKEKGSTPPPNNPSEESKAGSSEQQSQTPPPKQEATMQVNRMLAVIVWGMIVQTCVRLFGKAFEPRKFPDGQGGFLDENENVIGAAVAYFDSIGFVKLTPLWNLVLTILSYFLIRFNVLLDWISARRKKSSATKPAPVGLKPRPTPPPQPAPAPAPKPPEQPAPQSKPTEQELIELAEQERLDAESSFL